MVDREGLRWLTNLLAHTLAGVGEAQEGALFASLSMAGAHLDDFSAAKAILLRRGLAEPRNGARLRATPRLVEAHKKLTAQDPTYRNSA